MRGPLGDRRKEALAGRREGQGRGARSDALLSTSISDIIQELFVAAAAAAAAWPCSVQSRHVHHSGNNIGQ